MLTCVVGSWNLLRSVGEYFADKLFIKCTKTSMTDFFKAMGMKSLLEDGELSENLSSFRTFMLFQIYQTIPGIVLQSFRCRPES